MRCLGSACAIFAYIRLPSVPAMHQLSLTDNLSIEMSRVATTSLDAWRLSSPLGELLAVADTTGLYLLEFVAKGQVPASVAKLLQQRPGALVYRTTPLLQQLEAALRAYFSGQPTLFAVPLHLEGTAFQQRAWQALLEVPWGATRSYKQQAVALGQPTASRAVAQANRANRLAIVVPCHRIIYSNGHWGGYAGGIDRKKWLLQHEQRR